MDEFVREMHMRSGLLEEVASSTLTLEEAGRPPSISSVATSPSRAPVPLAGNSIGTDRRFLAA